MGAGPQILQGQLLIYWAAAGASLGLIAAMVPLSKAFTPDNFEGRWYAWLTNQIGHMSMMFVVSLLVVLVWVGVFDNPLPFKIEIAAFGLCASVAFQSVQYTRGGTIWDSLEDACFMGVYGSAASAYVLSPESPQIFNFGFIAAWFAVFVAHLAHGSSRRFFE
jgi:hypothetical protein